MTVERYFLAGFLRRVLCHGLPRLGSDPATLTAWVKVIKLNRLYRAIAGAGGAHLGPLGG